MLLNGGFLPLTTFITTNKMELIWSLLNLLVKVLVVVVFLLSRNRWITLLIFRFLGELP
jgi:hypothetical protein